MKCLHCKKELEEHEYKFCVTCLRALKHKYAKEALSMTELEFEDWLYEKYEIQHKADRHFRRFQN